MKRRPSRLLPAVAALLLSAALAPLPADAQTATDPNEGLRLTADSTTPGAYEVSWWGRSGRTYFLQRSEDLTGLWGYFPIIEPGHDAIIRYGFSNPADRVFARLRFIEGTLADPFGADNDGDGLTNQQEFDAKTDPFNRDTDGDGLPDNWELAHGLDPRDAADALADPNGNGVSNLDEYLNGNDPRLLAYGGVKPTLQIVSGDGQIPRSGQFLPLPMRARIRHPDGTPWAGVPVHFKAGPDEGLLAATPENQAPLRAVLTVLSDQNGYAQAWLKTP